MARETTAKPGDRAEKKGALSSIGDAYLQVDPRAFGAFRIAFGAVLIGDLLRHIPGLGTWFFDGAVMSPESIVRLNGSATPLSMFLFTTTPLAVVALILVSLVIFIGYAIGYRTRLMQALAFVAIIGLHGRNPYIEHAGERMVHILALVTAFMPLGVRYSIDALRVRRAQPETKPIRSVAFLVVTLQLCVTYALDWYVKAGPSWSNGTAILGSIEPMTGSVSGIWLRDRIPLIAFKLFANATRLIEAILPAMLLLPFRFLRISAATLMVALHVGIWSFINLGVFQPAMLAPVLLLLPPSVWDSLEQSKRLSPFWERVAALRARYGKTRRGKPTRLRRDAELARQAAAASIGCVLGLLVLTQNNVIPPWLRPPETFARPLRRTFLRLGIFEAWNHYADPRLSSGMLVVDAVTVDGRHVDPVSEAMTGRAAPPIEEIPRRIPMSLFWWNFEKGANTETSPLLRPLREWIERYDLRTGNPDDKITHYDIYWLVTTRSIEGQPLVTSKRLLRSGDAPDEEMPASDESQGSK